MRGGLSPQGECQRDFGLCGDSSRCPCPRGHPFGVTVPGQGHRVWVCPSGTPGVPAAPRHGLQGTPKPQRLRKGLKGRNQTAAGARGGEQGRDTVGVGAHPPCSSPSPFASTPFQNNLALTQRVWAPPAGLFPLFQPPQDTHAGRERVLGGVGAHLCPGDAGDAECSCQELGAPLEAPLEAPHGAVRALPLLLAPQLPGSSLSPPPPRPCRPSARLQGHGEERPHTARLAHIALCLVFLPLIVLGLFFPPSTAQDSETKTCPQPAQGDTETLCWRAETSSWRGLFPWSRTPLSLDLLFSGLLSTL